ncbi:MAG: Holliday junction branch migration protein RuvA [Lachnospiraceae bacterium]|nr:Holliday junction branch migration protein RuvA [Lachnospiraceae bacterium]
MIGFLRGKLAKAAPSEVVLDVGGVGYLINIPIGLSDKLHSIGEEEKLYTYMSVSENAVSLFGFLSEDDLSVFKQLITVSGIGPKGAQSILSVLSTDDLRFAVAAEDAKAISKAPGVGLKTAQRVILELKDKLGTVNLAKETQEEIKDSGRADSPIRNEVIEALSSLGYSTTEGYRAVKEAEKKGEYKDVSSLLKEALRYFTD